MSLVPILSGRQAVKTLSKVGYEKDRQNGSQIILRKNTYPYRRLYEFPHQEPGNQ